MEVMLLLLGAVALAWAGWTMLERWMERKYSVVRDLDACDKPARRREGTAVVVGASISGILAARVCAKHFEKVLLVDAEDCTTDPSVKRTRVKQHDQLHIFLALLYPALSRLFPAFGDEVLQHKGLFVEPQPVVYRAGGVVKLPPRSEWDVRQLYLSRELLEAILRKLLLRDCENVTAVQGTATRLVVDKTSDQVESVVVRYPDGTEREHGAALLVDASGTTNGSMGWLRKAGYPSPVKVTYDPSIVYTCFTFQLNEKTIEKYDALGGPYRWSETGHIGACFSSTHHSVFMRIDNDRVRTMYQTYTGQDTPGTAEDLLAEVLQAPYAAWQKEAVALLCRAHVDNGAPEPVRSKVNIGVCYRVSYDAGQMPGNLVPLGDTITRLNPIFGQGCTKSAIDALTLDRALRDFAGRPADAAFAAHFLTLHYARTDPFWNSTRYNDYACEETTPAEGESALTGSGQRRLFSWVVKAAQKDSSVGATLTRVMGGVESPLTYWYPPFLLRCALAHLRA